jgi:Ran GTPase-activating protein (RanGAP) involved in mRNA processing and transport
MDVFMSKLQLSQSLVFMLLLTLSSLVSLTAHANTLASAIVPIKPLSVQQRDDFFSLFDFPVNKKLNLPDPLVKLSDYPDFAIPVTDKLGVMSNSDLDLYKLNINNSNKLFYLLINSYSRGDSISAIYQIGANNKLIEYNEDNPLMSLSGYNYIEDISYCGAKVCVHFSDKLSGNWPDSCLYKPVPLIDDWVIWQNNKLTIFNRQITRAVCEGPGKPKLINQWGKQSVKIFWLYDWVDPDRFIEKLKKVKPTHALRSMQINDLPLGAKGIKQLGNWLAPIHSLTKLDLSYTRIFSNGVDSLVKIINNNPSLTYLDLSGNTFASQQAAKLATAIQNAKHLKTLRLAYSLFQAEAIEIMVATINANPHIEEVDLSHSGIVNKKAAEALIPLLDNYHIKKLDLTNYSPLTESLVKNSQFIRLLKNNKSLTSLQLGQYSSLADIRKLVSRKAKKIPPRMRGVLTVTTPVGVDLNPVDLGALHNV